MYKGISVLIRIKEGKRGKKTMIKKKTKKYMDRKGEKK